MGGAPASPPSAIHTRSSPEGNPTWRTSCGESVRVSSAGSSPLRRRRPRFRPDLRSGSSRPRSNAARNWWHGPAAGHRARRWSVASVADRMRSRLRRVPLHIIVFILPAAAIYTAFMIYPLFDSLRLSLHGNQEGGGVVFVGLQNYVRLIADSLYAPRFWGAVRHNLIFFAIHMLVQNPVGLLLAALLSARRLPGLAVYRTLLFSPTVLSFVIVGFIWQLILSPLWGIAGGLLRAAGLGALFYRTFFGFQLQLGNPFMGATVAGVMFLLILAGVLPYLFVWQRRIEVHEL